MPADQPLPESLAREGRAMLEAVGRDFLALPDQRLVLTWDRRLPLPQLGVQWPTYLTTDVDIAEVKQLQSTCQRVTLQLHDDRSAATGFDWCCHQADASLIIAPEINGELARQMWLARQHTAVAPCNAVSFAVEVCSDKRALFQLLSHHLIPTIPTQLVADGDIAELPAFASNDQLIVKPIDGAGSLNILHFTPAEFERWQSSIDEPDRWIVQPFLSGRALSVAGIFNHQGSLVHVWPVAEQHLDSRTFEYRGGRIPAANVDLGAVDKLIEAARLALPGLRGYIGFDLLQLPDGKLLLVEVNPRLTTSYVGYRALADESLAPWLMPDRVPGRAPHWRETVVRFTANGT